MKNIKLIILGTLQYVYDIEVFIDENGNLYIGTSTHTPDNPRFVCVSVTQEEVLGYIGLTHKLTEIYKDKEIRMCRVTDDGFMLDSEPAENPPLDWIEDCDVYDTDEEIEGDDFWLETYFKRLNNKWDETIAKLREDHFQPEKLN